MLLNKDTLQMVQIELKMMFFIEQPSVVYSTFMWEKDEKALSNRMEASSFLLFMKKWSERLKLFF